MLRPVLEFVLSRTVKQQRTTNNNFENKFLKYFSFIFIFIFLNNDA